MHNSRYQLQKQHAEFLEYLCKGSGGQDAYQFCVSDPPI